MGLEGAKVFDVGCIVGRFQTFHKGHQHLVDMGLMLCDRMLILVGSSNECGTERNPLNVETRIEMVKTVYPTDRIMIYALPDLTHENDITTAWGDYVLQAVDRYIFKSPEMMIYGNDDSRSGWFSKESLINTSEFIVNRGDIPISATKLRELMVKNDRREWQKWVHFRLHKMYDRIRSELMTVPYYQELERKLLASE